MIPLQPLRVFIGYDSREAIAYSVLAHSIIRRASRPVSITPLALDHLQRWLFTRVRDPQQSTEFTYTRFLVPYLSGYEGRSIFMDCDMLAQADVWDILGAASAFSLLAPPAVWVVKHDYVPRQAVKMDGLVQTAYPRKNWSSLMMFNNDWCHQLTPEYVNAASGRDLHRFHWLRDEEIGALPLEWNYLVGEDNQAAGPPKIVHFTNGGPWLPEYEKTDYADEWRAERDRMTSAG